MPLFACYITDWAARADFKFKKTEERIKQTGSHYVRKTKEPEANTLKEMALQYQWLFRLKFATLRKASKSPHAINHISGGVAIKEAPNVISLYFKITDRDGMSHGL